MATIGDGGCGFNHGASESKPEPELISEEDLAWVDSCLVAGPELPLENWVSFKEALVDSITDFSASYDENNAAGMDEDGEENGEQMEIDKEPEIAIGDAMGLWEVEITVSTENEFDTELKWWDLLEEENAQELNTELKWLDTNDDGN
ncbi:hypothetical protein KSP39_PZI024001 [Platanthera zijinensis]|uniref:Uncharacterized protein n=1 Tax=Platanthera zijinensis TaxID=2320716 RepID=A0AAP0ASB0_9ASPA